MTTFAEDPILVRLAAQIDEVEARLAERDSEGVDSAQFTDASVSYIPVEVLEKRRVELNRRYQQRRAELQGESLIFGRVVEHKPTNRFRF